MHLRVQSSWSRERPRPCRGRDGREELAGEAREKPGRFPVPVPSLGSTDRGPRSKGTGGPMGTCPRAVPLPLVPALWGSSLQSCHLGHPAGAAPGTEDEPGCLGVVGIFPPASYTPERRAVVALRGGRKSRAWFRGCVSHPAQEWGTWEEGASNVLRDFFIFRAALISGVKPGASRGGGCGARGSLQQLLSIPRRAAGILRCMLPKKTFLFCRREGKRRSFFF